MFLFSVRNNRLVARISKWGGEVKMRVSPAQCGWLGRPCCRPHWRLWRRIIYVLCSRICVGRHQSAASSNSAVPTRMLLTVSLLYVALCSCSTLSYIVAHLFTSRSDIPSWCVKALRPRLRLADRVYSVASQLHKLVFAYNFVVYVTTGRQFRRELSDMLCDRCAANCGRGPTSRQTSRESAETSV